VDLAGSPIPAGVPAIVFTVGHDPLRDEGIAYARALSHAGGSVEWIHAPDLYHGSFTQSGVLPTAAARVVEVCAVAQRLFA
jgi:acetyl esterase